MKITKRCLAYAVLIFAVFALFVACHRTKESKTPPTVSEIKSSSQSRERVKAGETVDLYVEVGNPSLRPLTFEWSVTSGGGTIEEPPGLRRVTYHAPPAPGEATVRLLVQDGNDVIATKTLKLQIISTVDPSKYGFESGGMGWRRQTYTGNQAVKTVAQTTEKAYRGSGSLKLTLSLKGGDANDSKGEAFIELRPPATDLQGKTITAWIDAPAGSAGDFHRPNGVQVFVKDQNFQSLYGTWINLVEEDWFEVSLTVNTTQPFEGYIDAGFDPRKIAMIGIKVAIGEGSKETYAGPIYVDAVNW